MEQLFELSAEYDAMLQRGLSLSGENKYYFLKGRVDDLHSQLKRDKKEILKILDFGCGIGDSSKYLSEVFPKAEVVGVDTAGNAIDYANMNFRTEKLRFIRLADFNESDSFDLCYVNGVFHHIEPNLRIDALKLILQALTIGGILALFENNPLNPGTRLVMAKIPFDRDAKTISPGNCRKLVLEAGFKQMRKIRFLFYFPAFLKPFRFLEPMMVHFPLGGQYYLLAERCS